MAGPERNAEDPKEALTFEQIVHQLSSLVTQLEDGELPLEQALTTFERGVALSRLGSKRLDAGRAQDRGPARRFGEQSRDRDSAFRRGAGR